MDQIAFRGCDETGNRCGLWVMDGGGGSRSPLTATPTDGHPTWSPGGDFIVFMSDGRHGNFELYRLDMGTGKVTRLTDHSAIDGIPAVSPDGQWVAFLSNRDGRWRIWTVPADGGEATVLAVPNGDIGNWMAHGIQWIE
jgi:TolB protein